MEALEHPHRHRSGDAGPVRQQEALGAHRDGPGAWRSAGGRGEAQPADGQHGAVRALADGAVQHELRQATSATASLPVVEVVRTTGAVR